MHWTRCPFNRKKNNLYLCIVRWKNKHILPNKIILVSFHFLWNSSLTAFLKCSNAWKSTSMWISQHKNYTIKMISCYKLNHFRPKKTYVCTARPIAHFNYSNCQILFFRNHINVHWHRGSFSVNCIKLHLHEIFHSIKLLLMCVIIASYTIRNESSHVHARKISNRHKMLLFI